jgi:hypothetical protein
MTTALIDKDTNATLANSFLVAERHVLLVSPPASGLPAPIGILLLHRLLESLLSVLVDLLLDHVLVQDLVIELERLLVYQLIVQALAISRLNDIALRVNTILVSFLSWRLVLTSKFLLLLNSVIVMFHESLGW